MLYLRMIVLMLVSLYTSRLILRSLGVVDMGIYNVVGGFVSFLAFINSAMSIAVQRFLSFDIGQKNYTAASKTFSIAIIIHICIAIFILFIGETLGVIFLSKVLNVPAQRYDTAVWVFHFSVITCCISILKIPFNALIISVEKMGTYAYLGIIEAILNLSVAEVILYFAYDKLKLYAGLICIAAAVASSFYFLYCHFKIKEVRFNKSYDKSTFSVLLGFATWSAIGEIAWAGAVQGVNIVLNVFFGPAINTSRAIAYQVWGAVKRVVQGFQTAVDPQIFKQYAAGDKTSMQLLVCRSTCISFYLLLFLSLPLLLKMDYVLGLWLGQVPDYAVAFCRLNLINALIDTVSSLLTTVIKATGKIRNYQMTVSAVLFLNLPLSYIALKAGCSPNSTFIVYGLISTTLAIIRMLFVKKLTEFSVTLFIKRVLFPIVYVTLTILPIPIFINMFLGNSFLSFVIVVFFSCTTTLVIVFLIGLKRNERLILTSKITGYMNRG